MKPVTTADDLRAVFPSEVEVVVWLDFSDAENLTAAARYLATQYTGPVQEFPDAEPGRQLYATIWPVDEEEIGGMPSDLAVDASVPGVDPVAALWTNAYMLALTRAATLLSLCGEAKIGGRIYAIRVQPVGAVFPSTYQVGSENQGRVLG
jgi:hypothetical protein